MKKGVTLMGHNTTGPPCSVGRPRPAAGPPIRSARRQCYRRQQTPASKTIMAN